MACAAAGAPIVAKPATVPSNAAIFLSMGIPPFGEATKGGFSRIHQRWNIVAVPRVRKILKHPPDSRNANSRNGLLNTSGVT